MKQLMLAVNRFVRDEEGATAIEYALIAALVSVVMVIALTPLGQSIKNTFTYICNQFPASVRATCA